MDFPTLLGAATGTGAGLAFSPLTVIHTFHASGLVSAGVGSATINIEVSNAPSPGANDWITLAEFVLALGTTSVNECFGSEAPWRWFRANVTAISGTGAQVSVYMSGNR